MRILFSPSSPSHADPVGCLRENEKCRFSVDVPRDCPVKQLFLELSRDDGFEMTVPLSAEGGKGDYVTFSCTFALFGCGLYFYCFRFVTEISEFRLYRLGDGDTNMEAGEKWQISCIPAGYSTPEELQGAVMYQIFPDRFAISGECDLSQKMTPYTVHSDRTEPPRKGPDSDGNWNNDFYGGNFRGIAGKLPYLSSLGCEVIYLNPIFKAYSNHRYDTADYKKPDPMLGTEEDFAFLCAEAGKHGIKIILDGVFSHVGSDSIYFDAKHRFGTGAVSNPASEYRDWFTFRHFPDDYVSWWDVPTLPCVDKNAPSFVGYIIDEPDSVVAHWMKLGAAGFRLDVADELPDGFIARLRKRVKEINPDGLVIGEVWEDASTKCAYGVRRRYFTGGELDGVMNYPYRSLIIGFVTGKNAPADFVSGIMRIYENYPRQALLTCMTSLSTHDTERIMTALSESLPAEKVGDAMRCAAAIQFFLPGMPCIYYGDETGMTGGADPFNRGFFTEHDRELTEFYRRLGNMRKNSPALRRGTLEITEKPGAVVISRSLSGEKRTLTVSPTEFDIR